MRGVEQLQIKKFEAHDDIRGDSGFAAGACDPQAVRRVVPVVETGAPVEVVAVAELENWA